MLGLGLGLMLCGPLVASAMAYKWPGDAASLGSAVAAKVIGFECKGVLTAAELGELDAYLTKAADELAQRQTQMGDDGYRSPAPAAIVQVLTEAYTTKYRDPRACDAGATEQARDTLDKVRKSGNK
jgi:hypothetical protein